MSRYDAIQRNIHPIPAQARTGLLTHDARDPDAGGIASLAMARQ